MSISITRLVYAYTAFFLYMVRHKWHIIHFSRTLHVPWWQCIIHDGNKLLAPQREPYVQTFYVYGAPNKHNPMKQVRHPFPGIPERIQRASIQHQQTNPHHWQYWLVTTTTAPLCVLTMPERYVREMVVDWIAAGIAQGKPDIRAWYSRHQHELILHPQTRVLVEQLLSDVQHMGIIP